MFIEPIQIRSLDQIDITQPKKISNQPAGGGFTNVFQSIWDTTTLAQQDYAQKQYLQSIGEIDDTHTVPIAAAQAELSLNLLVSLRNKALDAYNELMRMSV